MIVNNTKQLAIVIPAYKDTFLGSALDSIANQTCKNFTLYIGDDCSPYDLYDIVEKYKDKIDIVYKRFETNLGGKDLVAQWERCIAMSNDEPYIWLFSDDDIMESRCVETFLNLPENIKDDRLIHFDVNVINEENIVQRELDPFPNIMSAKDYLDGKLLGRKYISFVVEFIFSRKLYKKCNGFQNYDLAWGSDFLTWLKFAGECSGIYSISEDDAKVLWRKSSQNISPNKSHDIIVRKIKSLIENAAYIRVWLIYKGYCHSFRYLRYPLGEIKRNTLILKIKDIQDFENHFFEKIEVSYAYHFVFWFLKIHHLYIRLTNRS